MTLPLELGGIQDSYVRRGLELLAQRFPIGAIDLASGTAGTTFPTAPANGQEFYYVADATNGVVWHFKYRSASASASKWEFVGGPPLWSFVDTDETTASLTYAALATAGPSVTVPLAGDYLVEIHSNQYNANTATNTLHSFDVGGTGAIDNDGCEVNQAAAVTPYSVSNRRVKTGLAANTALVSKYKTSGGTGHFRRRGMLVTPIRVT